MRCLPEIRREGQTWRLPLSEQAAHLLLRRCLDPTNAHHIVDVDDVALILLVDPALVLWCLAQHARTNRFRCLAHIRDWILSDEFAACVGRHPLPQTDFSASRFRKLAASSHAAASTLNRTQRKTLTKRRPLVALIHNAREWFEPATRLTDLPISRRWQERILKFRSERLKTIESCSAKHLRRIRRAWPKKNTPFTDLLTLLHSGTAPSAIAQREKLASLRQLAYGASHEINNPLANISTRAQNLLLNTQDVALRKNLEAINRQAFRAHEMIADLMFFANPPHVDRESVCLSDIVGKVVDELAPEIPTNSIAVHQQLSRLQILGDAAQLSMAIKAILQNAYEALSAGGNIWIKLETDDSNGATRRARCTIRDDGPGFQEESLRHLFDPFYSGREAGRGLGFGLCKAWRIITNHGGQLVADRAANGGAQLSIWLPSHDQVVSR